MDMIYITHNYEDIHNNSYINIVMFTIIYITHYIQHSNKPCSLQGIMIFMVHATILVHYEFKLYSCLMG